jgi:hypothetical protein
LFQHDETKQVQPPPVLAGIAARGAADSLQLPAEITVFEL